MTKGAKTIAILSIGLMVLVLSWLVHKVLNQEKVRSERAQEIAALRTQLEQAERSRAESELARRAVENQADDFRRKIGLLEPEKLRSEEFSREAASLRQQLAALRTNAPLQSAPTPTRETR